MNTKLRTALLSAALLTLTCTGLTLAQSASSLPHDNGTTAPGKPLASPAATATTTLDGKSLTIKYNSPSARGRKIMGGQVPYGQVWRTGANPATTFITATDLKIGDLDIPAGTYTIYTLPAAEGTPWQLIINKQTGQWGTTYKPEMDLGRTPMMAKTVSPPQEAMSITFENVHGKTAELHIRWADADEYVTVSAK